MKIPEVLFRQAKPLFAAANGANAFEQRVLAVEVRRQQGNNLCWAAIVEGLERAYRLAAPRTQCRIASDALNGAPCCAGGSVSPACDNGRPMRKALGPLLHNAFTTPQSRTFAFIRSRINGGFPLVAQFDWNNGGQGHVVVITGYRRVGSNVDLFVCDPATGYRPTYRLEEFTNNFLNKGKWVATFETQGGGASVTRVAPE